MKKWLKGLVISAFYVVSITPISAQEYCSTPCLPCPSIFNGLYVGGHFGVESYRAERFDQNAYFFANIAPTGFVGVSTDWSVGIQLGYDWQCCRTLFGIVGDWDWLNGRVKTVSLDLPPLNDTIEAKIQWLSTLRVRAGFIAHPKALIYLSLGAAVADVKTKMNLTIGGFIDERNSFDQKLWGWAATLGTEVAIWRQWSINAEMLYANFASDQFKFFSSFRRRDCKFRVTDDVWIGRLGLNYHFSLSNLFR